MEQFSFQHKVYDCALITNKSKPSVRLSSYRVLFSPDVYRRLPLFLSLFCLPTFPFFFFVTDTPQYFAVLSSAQKKTVEIKLFFTDSCLHTRLNGFYEYYFPSVTANTLTTLYTGRPFLYVNNNPEVKFIHRSEQTEYKKNKRSNSHSQEKTDFSPMYFQWIISVNCNKRVTVDLSLQKHCQSQSQTQEYTKLPTLSAK